MPLKTVAPLQAEVMGGDDPPQGPTGRLIRMASDSFLSFSFLSVLLHSFSCVLLLLLLLFFISVFSLYRGPCHEPSPVVTSS